MGAEHGDRERRYFGQILDEDRALVLQAFDHVFVVNDLVAHIDRWAVFFERALDDLDGTHHPRTKSAGLRKIHFHGTPVTQVAPKSYCLSLWHGCLQYPHHAGSRTRSLSQVHGGTALCVKKRLDRKDGSHRNYADCR